MRARWQPLLLACAVAAAVRSRRGGGRDEPAGAGAIGTRWPDRGTGADGCPSSNAPNELVLVDGTPQTAPLETGFANPLEVQLANTNGCPITTAVGGTPVTFTAPNRAGRAPRSPRAARTRSPSAATPPATRPYRCLTPTTPPAATPSPRPVHMEPSRSALDERGGRHSRDDHAAAAGKHEHATVNSRYTQPLAVRVLDANGNPVVGANVAFSLGSAGGGAGSAAAAGASFDDGATQATETTDADGIATSPRFDANAASGAFTATATVAHVTEPARFTLGNLAAKAPTLTPAGPGSASATIGTRFARSLRVTVRNSSGTHLAGVTVTFTLGATRSRQRRSKRHLHRWLDGGHRNDRPTRRRDLSPPGREQRRRIVHRDRKRGRCAEAVRPSQPCRLAIENHRRSGRRPVDCHRDALRDPARGHGHRRARQ